MISTIPKNPVVGQSIHPGMFRDIGVHGRATQIIEGPGIHVEHTPDGARISLLSNDDDKYIPPKPFDIFFAEDKAICTNCIYWRGSKLYQVPDLSVAIPADSKSVILIALAIDLDSNLAELTLPLWDPGSAMPAGLNEDLLDQRAEYVVPLYVANRSGDAWRVALDLRSTPQLFVYS